MTDGLPPEPLTGWPAPTPEVARLVQIIGLPAAFALIERHGGTFLYIPEKPAPDGALARLVGTAGAEALAAARGGEMLKVPVARAWRILVHKAYGCSYSEMARATGCSVNTIWRILSRAGATAVQLDLFER